MAPLGPTWFYTIPTMALFGLHSLYNTLACLYVTLPWIYLAVPDSSTLHATGVSVLVSTWLYNTVSWTLLGSHWLYCTLKWLYLALPDSTTLCHGCTCLYFTPLYSTMALHGSTWLYLPQLHSTLVLLGSHWFSYILLCLYLARLDSTTLYQSSSWSYHGSSWLYHGSTWLYLTEVHCSYHVSTCLYLTLQHSTMDQHCFTSLYYTLPWLYLVLLDSATRLMALPISTWPY